jgi:hypothetical protein
MNRWGINPQTVLVRMATSALAICGRIIQYFHAASRNPHHKPVSMISGKTLRILLVLNLAVMTSVLVLLGRGETRMQNAASSISTAAQGHNAAPLDDATMDSTREKPVGTAAAPVTARQEDSAPENAPSASGAALATMDNSSVQTGNAFVRIVPAIFMEPRPEDHFTASDMITIREMRDQFTNALNAAPRLDPNSPEYYARWKALQADFDSQFKANFGTATLLKYQDLASDAQSGS